jgi:hypothetical protein
VRCEVRIQGFRGARFAFAGTIPTVQIRAPYLSLNILFGCVSVIVLALCLFVPCLYRYLIEYICSKYHSTARSQFEVLSQHVPFCTFAGPQSNTCQQVKTWLSHTQSLYFLLFTHNVASDWQPTLQTKMNVGNPNK